jgi:hypothetical protein
MRVLELINMSINFTQFWMVFFELSLSESLIEAPWFLNSLLISSLIGQVPLKSRNELFTLGNLSKK